MVYTIPDSMIKMFVGNIRNTFLRNTFLRNTFLRNTFLGNTFLRTQPTIRTFCSNSTYKQNMLNAIKSGNVPKLTLINNTSNLEELPFYLGEFMVSAVENKQHDTLKYLLGIRDMVNHETQFSKKYCGNILPYYLAMEDGVIAAIKNRDHIATSMFIKEGVNIFDTDGKLLSDLLDKRDYLMLNMLARDYKNIATLYNSWAKLMPRLTREYRDLYDRIDLIIGDSFIFNGEQLVFAATIGNIEFIQEMIVKIEQCKDIPSVSRTFMTQEILVRALHSAIEYNHPNIVLYLLNSKYSYAVQSGINEALVIAAKHNNIHIGRILCGCELIDLNYNNSEALDIARTNKDIEFIQMMYDHGAKVQNDDLVKIIKNL